jgi:hypothetical protein
MSTSVKVAFALVVVSSFVTASFAQRLVATRKVPITTPGSSGGKCVQQSPAVAAAHNRAEFVHPDGGCWAPQDRTDDAGV